MIFKLKFGALTGYFEEKTGELTIMEATDGEALFSKTSSFEINLNDDERKAGIEKSMNWPQYAVNLVKGQFNLYPGLGVIYGASGAGKTQLLNFVFKTLKDNKIKARKIMFNEPDLLVSERSAAIVSEDQLLHEVAKFLISDDEILFIDSIRTFIYSVAGGATGKGGVDMTMYTRLTELSILAQLLGKSINVVFNPISADDAVVQNIKEAVKGSVETIYFIDGERRTLNSESRNYHAKRQMITVPYDPETLIGKRKKVQAREQYEFKANLTEGLVGPLSQFGRKRISDTYTKIGL